ncbi:MAG: TRAP transporter substrate-binding protein DctP [Clostridiales bacterium]|nr:TRAP transporter substrate-binding protein DctP [Clostridiales bacterium]
MKKLLSITLAAIMLLSIFAACGAPKPTPTPTQTPDPTENPQPTVPASVEGLVYDGPAMELTVNFSSTEANQKPFVDAFDRITERSGGKITFVIYYSNSLLSPGEALDGLGSGVCDISDITMANFPERFVYSQQVMSYPFLGFTSIAMASDVMNRNFFKNELMMNEFKATNIHPLFFLGVWGTSMVFKNPTEISTPDTVSGLKLVTDNRILTQFLADKGATPVGLPPTEFYSSLSNNVVDGLINGIHVINIFGALSIAKSVYLFERSFATGCRAICINNDVWSSFDDTLKQIFTEELLGEQLREEAVEHWTKSDQSHLDDCAEWNIPITRIEGEQMQAWVDALKPYGDEQLKQLSDKGYTEVYNVLEFINDAIENYDGGL